MTTNDIFTKAKHRSGMTVPEGYFEDFNRRMAASLPQQEWEKAPVTHRRSRWQIMRPYVYMAAMFAGIWCMMQMFDMLRSSASYELTSNKSLMSAIDNDSFYFDYCTSASDDGDLYDDLYAEGFDPASLSVEESTTESL